MSYYNFEISPEDESEFESIKNEIQNIESDIESTNRAIGELETECEKRIKEIPGEIGRAKQLVYNNTVENVTISMQSFLNINEGYINNVNRLVNDFNSFLDSVIKIEKQLKEI